jgi:3-isopropylmalate/(R)-2-methylmalate dehydratase small subunit
MAETKQLIHTGRVWKFGDEINTDLILPHVAFRLPKSEQHKLCFEAIRPGWVNAVRPGDLIVAGENFGMGSGRPVGPILRTCGIVGIVAESINGLCLRNCLNFSLPGIDCPGVTAIFEDGDTARVDFLTGLVENVTRGTSIQGKALAPLLAEMVMAGGVIPMLLKEGYIHAEPFVASSS